MHIGVTFCHCVIRAMVWRLVFHHRRFLAFHFVIHFRGIFSHCTFFGLVWLLVFHQIRVFAFFFFVLVVVLRLVFCSAARSWFHHFGVIFQRACFFPFAFILHGFRFFSWPLLFITMV